jgi:hypothetical protein
MIAQALGSQDTDREIEELKEDKELKGELTYHSGAENKEFMVSHGGWFRI